MNDGERWQMEDLGEAPMRERPRSRHRILLVDDDVSIRALVTEVLEQAGYEVEASVDGARGLEALQAKDYDLLVTDNQMPNLTGIQMVKALRGLGATLPVIMASGTVLTEEVNHHPSFAISAILLKPYTIAKLLETVKEVLRDRAAERSDFADGKGLFGSETCPGG
jgi:DNA-binding response OmpR family regulator